MQITILENYNKQEIMQIMQDIMVEPYGINIMSKKANSFIIKIDKIKNISANILKQQMLSLGGDAAISKQALIYPKKETPVLLIGNENIFIKLVSKLEQQMFGFKNIALEIKNLIKKNNIKQKKTKVSIMGILNVTPDSFYDKGKYFLVSNAILRANEMIKQGADIIDVGAESTRPNADKISLKEEKKRILPVIHELSKNKKIILSIDTSKYEIAKECLGLGAKIINDVSGLLNNEKMAKIIAEHNAKVIIMHSNRNSKKKVENIIEKIIIFLKKQIEFACKNGIKEENIFIDPGIGFGKTFAENLLIINKLKEFTCLGFPLVIGASRKSFIGKVLNKEAKDRLIGSISVNVIAIMKGANILRVHDVAETYEAIKMTVNCGL